MNYEDKRNGIIEAAAENGQFGAYLERPYSNKQRIEIVGQNLVFLRRIANASQKDICDIIGVAPQTYSGYEKGKHEPTIETLVRLAHLYNVTVDYIVSKYHGDDVDEGEDYIKNIAENPVFEDMQAQLYELREQMSTLTAIVKDLDNR